MQHLDEHTIELYVLAAPEVAGRRKEIERHLKSCARCMTLHDDLKALYADFAREMEQNSHLGEREKRGILRRTSEQIDFPLDDAATRHYEPFSRIERFQRFVGRNAVPAAFGMFGVFAVLLFFIVIRGERDKSQKNIVNTNPAYVHINKGASVLEVYNKNDQKLWDIPGIGLDRVDIDESFKQIHFTAIADLYGDERTEVITCLQNIGAESADQAWLRIYDGKKQLLHKADLNEKPITFGSDKYEGQYNTDGLVINRRDGDKEPIISVAMSHYIRSPFYLICLDSQARVVGEYWHFGQLASLYRISVSQTLNNEVLLAGTNDVEDEFPRGPFHVIVVLDPSKVVGKRESELTKGFGLAPSDAELFYIRFPWTDMDSVLNLKPGVIRLIGKTNRELHFIMRGGDRSSTDFEYVLSYDMKVLQVKPTDQSVQTHNKLVEEGKITGAIDETYLTNLRKAVRYWDGKKWQKKVTMIHH